MPTIPRPKKYAWVTWLTGLLSGDAQCHYAAWFKSSFKYDKVPSDFSFAAWRVQHTALVNTTVERLKAEGWTVTVEDQNAFKLEGKTATLAGKPDVIGRKANRVRVIDCKTGQPSNRDWVQVCIYMIAIPLVWDRSNLSVEGEVVYKTQPPVAIAPDEPHQIRDDLFDLLRTLATGPQPPTVPSVRECAWCDIAACADRQTTETPVALTEAF